MISPLALSDKDEPTVKLQALNLNDQDDKKVEEKKEPVASSNKEEPVVKVDTVNLNDQDKKIEEDEEPEIMEVNC